MLGATAFFLSTATFNGDGQIRNRPDNSWKAHDIATIRELALGAIPQSVIVADASDPANPIIFANDAFLEMTGYTASEVIGRNCNMLAGAETDNEIRGEIRKALAEHGPFHGLVLNYRKDGAEFWNDLTIVPVTHGEHRYFVGVQHDVTERVALEASLRESQKMEALGKLSGGVAHDFNNILALIMGNAEIIAAEPVAPLISAAAREIVEAADSGSQLVNRMLQFAGGRSEPTELVDINHLVRNVIMMLERTMSGQVSFVADLSEAVGRVQIDKTMFRTALINLALNARDAMPDGGTITITTRRRANPTADIEDGVVVAVADTGVGMSDAAQRRAFEPFFTTKQEGRGTGLGLSMVYRFVNQAGGDVTISSTLGSGTTFTLLLPVRTELSTVESSRETPRDRILVVEDDPKVRKMLSIQLDRAGYSIDEAANAAEATDLIDHTSEYRLVISDIRLGAGMSGVELVAAIRGRRPGMPVLLITAHSDELDDAPRHIDGVPILRKPFRTRDLLETVEQMLAGMTLVLPIDNAGQDRL